jgi:hypothetical protein
VDLQTKRYPLASTETALIHGIGLDCTGSLMPCFFGKRTIAGVRTIQKLRASTYPKNIDKKDKKWMELLQLKPRHLSLHQ